MRYERYARSNVTPVTVGRLARAYVRGEFIPLVLSRGENPEGFSSPLPQSQEPRVRLRGASRLGNPRQEQA